MGSLLSLVRLTVAMGRLIQEERGVEKGLSSGVTFAEEALNVAVFSSFSTRRRV